MKHLQIKNVPDTLHAEVRRRAAEQGLTMSAFIIELLEHEFAVPDWHQWLNELHALEPVETHGSALEALHAGREERDAQLAAAHEGH